MQPSTPEYDDADSGGAPAPPPTIAESSARTPPAPVSTGIGRDAPRPSVPQPEADFADGSIDRIRPLVTEIRARFVELNNREAEAARREQELEALKRRLVHSAREYVDEETRALIERLEQRSTRLDAEALELSARNARVADREHNLDQRESEIERRRADLEGAIGRLREQEETARRYIEEQRRALVHRIATIRARESDLGRRIELARDELRRERAELADDRATAQEQRESLARERQSLEARAVEVRQRHVEMQARTAELESRYIELAAQRAELEAARIEAESASRIAQRDREAMADRRRQFEQQIAAVRAERDGMQREISRLESQRDTLGQERDALEERIARLRKEEQALRETNRTLAEGESRLAALATELDARERALLDAKQDVEKRTQAADARRAEYEQRRSEIEAEHEQWRTEAIRVRAEIEQAAQARAEELDKQRAELEESVKQAQEDIERRLKYVEQEAKRRRDELEKEVLKRRKEIAQEREKALRHLGEQDRARIEAFHREQAEHRKQADDERREIALEREQSLQKIDAEHRARVEAFEREQAEIRKKLQDERIAIARERDTALQKIEEERKTRLAAVERVQAKHRKQVEIDERRLAEEREKAAKHLEAARREQAAAFEQEQGRFRKQVEDERRRIAEEREMERRKLAEQAAEEAQRLLHEVELESQRQRDEIERESLRQRGLAEERIGQIEAEGQRQREQLEAREAEIRQMGVSLEIERQQAERDRITLEAGLEELNELRQRRDDEVDEARQRLRAQAHRLQRAQTEFGPAPRNWFRRGVALAAIAGIAAAATIYQVRTPSFQTRMQVAIQSDVHSPERAAAIHAAGFSSEALVSPRISDVHLRDAWETARREDLVRITPIADGPGVEIEIRSVPREAAESLLRAVCDAYATAAAENDPRVELPPYYGELEDRLTAAQANLAAATTQRERVLEELENSPPPGDRDELLALIDQDRKALQATADELAAQQRVLNDLVAAEMPRGLVTSDAVSEALLKDEVYCEDANEYKSVAVQYRMELAVAMAGLQEPLAKFQKTIGDFRAVLEEQMALKPPEAVARVLESSRMTIDQYSARLNEFAALWEKTRQAIDRSNPEKDLPELLRNHSDSMDAARRHVQTTEAVVREIRSGIESLSAQSSGATRDIVVIAVIRGEINTLVEGIALLVVAMQSIDVSMNAQLDTLDRQVRGLDRRLSYRRETVRQQLQQAADEAARTERSVEIEQVQRRMLAAQSRREELVLALAQKTHELRALDAGITEHQRRRMQRESAEAAIAQASAEISRLQRDIQAAKAIVEGRAPDRLSFGSLETIQVGGKNRLAYALGAGALGIALTWFVCFLMVARNPLRRDEMKSLLAELDSDPSASAGESSAT